MVIAVMAAWHKLYGYMAAAGTTQPLFRDDAIAARYFILFSPFFSVFDYAQKEQQEQWTSIPPRFSLIIFRRGCCFDILPISFFFFATRYTLRPATPFSRFFSADYAALLTRTTPFRRYAPARFRRRFASLPCISRY